MIHFDRVCAAVGFLVMAVSAIVFLGALAGVPLKWPCTYKATTKYETVEREGICEPFRPRWR